jgi:hypothetical protein
MRLCERAGYGAERDVWRYGGFPGLTNGSAAVGWTGYSLLRFWGRRGVGTVTDGGHHGEGEHDEGEVAMPAMPGAGLVVVEPELVLSGLEAVLDGPAMSFDLDQSLGVGSGRTPGGEEGEVGVGDIPADQEAPRP